jgi:hypothetical protein
MVGAVRSVVAITCGAERVPAEMVPVSVAELPDREVMAADADVKLLMFADVAPSEAIVALVALRLVVVIVAGENVPAVSVPVTFASVAVINGVVMSVDATMCGAVRVPVRFSFAAVIVVAATVSIDPSVDTM